MSLYWLTFPADGAGSSVLPVRCLLCVSALFASPEIGNREAVEISRVLLAAAGVLVFLALSAADCLAQGIRPFGLTGVDGYVSTRYFRDEFVTTQSGARQPATAQSRQSQSDVREELFLMTHNYVYHPNFLTLDIGGGPILEYGTSSTDADSTQSFSGLYNLTGRATFLREKPYRGSLFYDHLNPTVSISPGQILTQETTRYGFEFSLLEPVTPVPLQIDAARFRSQGSGPDRIIDETIDRANVRASRALGTIGTTQAQYQGMWQKSLSGSPNLPIQGTSSESHGLNMDSRLHFGADQQYEILNLITLNHQTFTLNQGTLPDRNDARVLLDARAAVSSSLHTFGAYNYTFSDQGTATSALHSATAGLSYAPTENLATALGVHGDQNRTGELSAQSYGVDGSIRYQRPLLFGVGQASYAVRYDQRTQQAGASQTNVIGERIILRGTVPVSLSHPRVIPGSVVVSNATRSQTFTEGSDYTLTVVGLDTRVQRLIAGNIVDGQELLVDYGYDPGGTFTSTELNQTFTLGWNLSRYLNVYYRHLEARPSVTSGTPSSPLNTIQSDLYGARADIPLKLGIAFSLGGGYEQEYRRETIAPYRRDTFDVYAQNDEPLFDTTTIRVSAHRTRLAYDTSAQNVEVFGYGARLWWWHPLGIDLSAEASWEQDAAGTAPRRWLTGAVKAQWRFRKVTLMLDGGLTRESQGTVQRNRTLIQFQIRRDF